MAKKTGTETPATPLERVVARGVFVRQCLVALAVVQAAFGYLLMIWHGPWSEGTLQRYERPILRLVDEVTPAPVYAHAVSHALAAIAIFLTIVIVVFVIARGKTGRPRSFPGSYTAWAIAVTRNSKGTGIALIAYSFAALLIFGWYLIEHPALASLTRVLPVFASFAMAFATIGAAVLAPLPFLLADAQEFKEEQPPIPAPPPARITGEEFLALLRQSPIFRRQIEFDHKLGEVPFAAGEHGIERYLRRFPRMAPFLDKIGIASLTHDQTTAIAKILDHETSGKPMDYLFIGRPGSGRTTTANLLALGAALQKEGAIYCITPDSPEQSVDYDSESNRRAMRHAATQLRDWINRSKLSDTVTVTESYRLSQTPGDIDINADIVVTDARIFSQANEARALELLKRLRYVIVDQPERLSREDFVKLRIALCRLRLVAEMMGRPLTYLVILPRLNNSAEVGKYLLNHTNVEPSNFGTWTGKCHVVGWMPALEIANADEDELPRFARSNFIEEVTALLSEIGTLANNLDETISVAVTDAQPLLGPEARERIREAVRDQLARAASDQPLVVKTSWTYFTATDVGVERQGEYDVVICLGAGRHPRETIASVRPAVAADGVIIIVADSSPADLDTFDVLMRPGWSPELEDERRRYPTLLLPDHSDAVLAYELARLFEEFSDSRTAEREGIPLPTDRLLEVFPGRDVGGLLREWQTQGNVKQTFIFDDLREGHWPRRRECLKRMSKAFRGDLYEIPWGCCSGQVYSVFDRSANRQVMAGLYLNDWIDKDRLFIDFHPISALRYRPNSVLVRRVTPPASFEAERRFTVLGTVEVEQMQRDDAIRIDRRAPRIAAEIVDEWSRETDLAASDVPRDPTIAGMGGLLRPREDTQPIVQRLSRLQVGTIATPRIGFIGGEWYAKVRERIRDVVRTDARLVEEPDFTSALQVPLGSVTSREYECVAVSLFLHRRREPVRTNDELRPAATPDDPLHDYASLHGLARVMTEVLRRDFLSFDREFRVSVMPTTQRIEGISPYRIVIYKLRSEELGWEHTLASVLEPEDLYEMLQWAHGRLEKCDCDNGCSRCCGGLGTMPAKVSHAAHFTPEDEVSRTGAYLLVCDLLNKLPNWELFREGALTGGRLGQPLSDRQLARFVEEVIGTAAGTFQDGIWHKLFGLYMPLHESFLAAASWMDDGSERADCAGYYRPATNQVFVRPDYPLSFIREIIIHEFVHNWQFRSEGFDLDLHLLSPNVQQYFEGKLVIEGHAVWAEQMYRLFMRRGPVYTPNDGRPWNEYKAGFLLMESIEKAVGQDGLFAWLRKGAKPGHIRSRDKRLPWPFTLEQALDKLDLRRYVRRQAFTGFDVGESDPSPPQPPQPQQPEQPEQPVQ